MVCSRLHYCEKFLVYMLTILYKYYLAFGYYVYTSAAFVLVAVPALLSSMRQWIETRAWLACDRLKHNSLFPCSLFHKKGIHLSNFEYLHSNTQISHFWYSVNKFLVKQLHVCSCSFWLFIMAKVIPWGKIVFIIKYHLCYGNNHEGLN